MAEYSREDARNATRIVESLLSGEAEGLSLEQDLAVSDLESDANVFSGELALLEDYDIDFPAARIGDRKVPVSLRLIVGQSDGLFPFNRGGTKQDRYWRRHPYFYEEMYHFLRSRLRDGRPNEFTTMSREEARTTFVERASDFLATRIVSVRGFRDNLSQRDWNSPSMLTFRQMLGGAPVVTPGCHFTVSTNSSGLRVFWSGAYFVTPNNFSSPTTPTSSVLQSGTYIFGVDGGAYGNTIQWDLNLVVSLPGIPNAHLNY
jgi:hypothetical protein